MRASLSSAAPPSQATVTQPLSSTESSTKHPTSSRATPAAADDHLLTTTTTATGRAHQRWHLTLRFGFLPEQRTAPSPDLIVRHCARASRPRSEKSSASAARTIDGPLRALPCPSPVKSAGPSRPRNHDPRGIAASFFSRSCVQDRLAVSCPPRSLSPASLSRACGALACVTLARVLFGS